jgi:anti-sigma regulatory factor (Ser/Thr protein kinase)
MSDHCGDSVTLWPVAHRLGAAAQPAVAVALCVTAGTGLARRLQRAGIARSCRVFTVLAEARAAIARQLPVAELIQLRLRPEPASADQVRDMVAQLCRAWSMPKMTRQAAIVAGELVYNAIEHAGTDLVVTVSRRGDGLHLAVHDRGARLPALLQPTEEPAGSSDHRGRGLRLVHAIAVAWGAMPTRDGKVVWATIRPGREGRPTGPGGAARSLSLMARGRG